jgi:hypothetical protein
MSTQARIDSSRANGARSLGPVTAQGKERSRDNSMRHGLRSDPRRALALPGESREELAALRVRWENTFQPRDEAEWDLVSDVISARWMLLRAEGAHFNFLNSRAHQAGDREDSQVSQLMNRLFWDRRGPLGAYALANSYDDGPGTSSLDSPNDPNEPSELVRQLTSTPKGCQALIDNWRSLGARASGELPWQPQDRLMAIRMVGRQPTDAARDDRVRLIFVAAFALDPKDRAHPYEDLKSDLGTVELKAFLDRVTTRGPLVLDAQDTAAATKALVDLVSENLLRLEAKLELHQQLAEENGTSTDAPLSPDDVKELERLRRFEAACQRRVHRCEDAFWKHRRATEGGTEDGGRRVEGGEGAATAGTATDSGVAEEGSDGPKTNLTSEPSFVGDAAEGITLQDVATSGSSIDLAFKAMRAMREAGFGPAARPAGAGRMGRAAIAAAISASGPLLRPIS